MNPSIRFQEGQPPSISVAVWTVTAAVILTVKGVNFVRPYINRHVPTKLRELRLFLHERVYLQYRSEISLIVALFLLRGSFECDCCCLRLGKQDQDLEYHQHCHCSNGSIYCRRCTITYLSGQVTNEQATSLVCMDSRQCVMDERYVRRLLNSRVLALLDRYQIVKAVCGTRETLWTCPCADCTYMGFVSRRNRSSNPSWRTYLFSRIIPMTDSRRIRCPSCHITSCQVCGKVWTRGVVDHTGISCAAYANALQHTGTEEAAFAKYKSDHTVQDCPRCGAEIEKTEGCNHMTCRCGHEFCWVCGEMWTRRHSYQCRRHRHNRNASFAQRSVAFFVGGSN